MIAIHHGTPAAVDARVREEFVEHLCLVNDDFNHEKRALLEENDALAAENVTLRKEADLYRAGEEMQIALRKKSDKRAAELEAYVEQFNILMGGIRSEMDCGDESDVDLIPEELWALWRGKPTTSLARHDADLLAQPLKNISGCSDHSCLIRKPEGMGTNGGCRCHTDRSKASIIFQRLATLRDKAAGGL